MATTSSTAPTRAAQPGPEQASQAPQDGQDGQFAALGLNAVLLKALDKAGFTRPTPIQTQAIPPTLAGRDVVGCAQTGTGKTAAFALPMLQRLAAQSPEGSGRRPVRALILAPTRELASQIGENLGLYESGTGLRHQIIFGGTSQLKQVRALERGTDVLVATPGRLVDLINQRLLDLSSLEVLVLDEFDRMLDQGFLPAIRKVLQVLPKRRQTLLFSATMPRELEAVVSRMVNDPVRVTVDATSSTPKRIDQSAYLVDKNAKSATLRHLLRAPEVTSAVVFSRTKHGANRIARQLQAAGLAVDAIHGNKSQSARESALSRFKSGKLQVLVATDIAARGIDIDGISHVINYDLPADPEAYVHRIGRTARAGRSGVALSLYTADERGTLQRIERLIGERLRQGKADVVDDLDLPPLQSAQDQGQGDGRRLSHSSGNHSGGHQQGGQQERSRGRRPQKRRRPDDRGGDRNQTRASEQQATSTNRSSENHRSGGVASREPNRQSGGATSDQARRSPRPVRSYRPSRPVRNSTS